jgi:hypothetical protein
MQQILEVKVIRWPTAEDRWAVAIRYSNGLKQFYEVGDRAQAERERAQLERTMSAQGPAG